MKIFLHSTEDEMSQVRITDIKDIETKRYPKLKRFLYEIPGKLIVNKFHPKALNWYQTRHQTSFHPAVSSIVFGLVSTPYFEDKN